MKKSYIGGLVCAVLTWGSISSFGQNALEFTGVNVTPDKSIQLHWASNTNEIYEIDYADSLIDTNTGTTTWTKLYDDYPSHGTNTFVADAGNYDIVPDITHPKNSEMRFYRVVLTGTNSSPTNPIVEITSPTNGATITGDAVISVFASSSEYLSDVKLYIDGEEQWQSFDGTNFLINTCEWANGQHTIFATAKSQSGIEGFTFGSPLTYGSAVSAYVNVSFDNLISSVDLSEPYFEPSLGQTQHVSAIFAANCDWTLQIQDASSNTVRTVTGNGISMGFDWDGNNDSEASIPDGVYTYLISAETNSASSMMSSELSSTTLKSSDDTTQLWALSEGSENPVPFALYPSGFDTNGLTIFEASQSEINYLIGSLVTSMSIDSPSVELATLNASTPSNQTTRAPKKKPKIGVKNKNGTFGICYQTYPDGAYSQEPRTGRIYPLQPIFTGVDGSSPSSVYHYFTPLKTFKPVASGFAQIMKIGATNGTYKPAFIKGDGDWSAQDIKSSALGGNSLFNTCNFGLLLTHGVYGTQPEIDGIYYTYLLLFDNKHGTAYVRLSDMDFGSSGADGLRWMTILSCNMLNPNNVTSMINNSKLAANDNLHLLLGATTYTYSVPKLGAYYATNLVEQTTIWQSFQNAGTTAYQEAHAAGASGMTNTVTFRVMGYQSCLNDTLFQYNDPDQNTAYQIINSTVFTP